MPPPRRRLGISALSAIVFMLACAPPALPQDPPGAAASTIELSPQEKAWLAEHPTITVFQDPGWPPVEFVGEDGLNQGISEDYLALIEDRAGIKFERVLGLSWPEAYAKLKRHEIDMTTSVAITPERSEFWAFTRQYMVTPIVYVTRMDVTYISDMRELLGKRVAVVDGYAVCDWIPRDYPGMDLVKVPSAADGLRLVAKGEVFAFIENMLVVGYYIAKLRLNGLKIAGTTPYENAQSMAVRKDWEPLVGILQKALDTVSDEERDRIYYEWVPIRYEYGFDTPLFWRTIATLFAVILALSLWIARMSLEIRKRKKAEAALAESESRLKLILLKTPVAVIEWDLEMRVVGWNPGAESVFGYAREEMLGRKADIIVPDDTIEAVRGIWARLAGRADSVLSQNNNIARDGRVILCDWINTSMPGPDGAISWVVSIVRDITAERQAADSLRAALGEKEILLRELFHRTKNNMNVITSFMQLQAMSARNPDLSALVRKNVLRIQAMALAQEELYSTKTLSRIDLGRYASKLVENLSRHFIESGKEVAVDVRSDRIDVALDVAIPCGLILNELAMNSFAHAFAGRTSGSIRVTLRTAERGVEIRYADDGVGLAPGTDLRALDSLGMVTVFGVAEGQLGAAVSYASGDGLSWAMRFDPDALSG